MSTNGRVMPLEAEESDSALAGCDFQNKNATTSFGPVSPLESTPLDVSLSTTTINIVDEELSKKEPRISTVSDSGAEVSTSPADATAALTSQRLGSSCVDLSRLISAGTSTHTHSNSSDASVNPVKRLENAESTANGKASGRGAAGNWATAPLPPNAPTTTSQRVPPFPMLGAIRARENILSETHDAPHKPGYATPMRTSVVELLPGRVGASSDADQSGDASSSPTGNQSLIQAFLSSGAATERIHASRGFDLSANNSSFSNSSLSESDASLESLHDGLAFSSGARTARPSAGRDSRKIATDSSSPIERPSTLHSSLMYGAEHNTPTTADYDATTLPTPHTFGDLSASAGERAFPTLLSSAGVASSPRQAQRASAATSPNSPIGSTHASASANSSSDMQYPLLPGHDHGFASSNSAPISRPHQTAALQVGVSPSGSPALGRTTEQAPKREFMLTTRNAGETSVSASTSFSKKNTPSSGSPPGTSVAQARATATPAAAFDRPTNNTHSSGNAAAAQPSPAVLTSKPKLIKHRSAMDNLTSTSPPSNASQNIVPVLPAESSPKKVHDPFEDMKPDAEVPWNDLIFDTSSPCLGDGNEGDVLLARLRNTPVAVKMGDHKRILKEQKMVSGLSHPHVIRTIGFSKRDPEMAQSARNHFDSAEAELLYGSTSSEEMRGSPATTPSPVPVLRPAGSYAAIYEYCANKDLMTYLSATDARNDVAKMTQIFDDILAGLEYIHDPKRSSAGPIVHGDVKPENVMIDHNGRAKLGDFGLAQHQAENMDVQGTPSYIAPEVVLDFLAGSTNPNFTTKADMFSFGVLMVVALTGHYPFKRLTAKLHSGQMSASQVIKHFTPSRRALKTISDLSPRFKRMVDSCLCRYPEMRPSATQLRNILFRRSKPATEDSRATGSRAEVGKLPINVTVTLPPNQLPSVIPASSYTYAADENGETVPSIQFDMPRVSPPASMASKVPASLAHLVLGPAASSAATVTSPLIPIPVSSGKFSD